MNLECPVSKYRLERFVRFLSICGLAWACFGVFYLLNGRQGDAILCFGEATFSVSLIAFAKRVGRRVLANWYLAGVTLGIVVESYLSGLGISFAPAFFSIVVLLAAHQLGPRAAWVWGAVCMGCLITIHFMPQQMLPVMPGPSWIERFAGQAWILLLATLFASIAEATAEQYAIQLEAASEELREGAVKLNEMLGIDPLTQLPNRVQFNRDVDDALRRAQRNKSLLAILVIDLDGFKQINDKLGHAAGDQVLQEVAIRLREALEVTGGKIARLGGDEFTVLLEDLPDRFAAALAGGKIVRSISRDYRLDGRDLKLGASVGAALYPQDGDSIDELLSFADAAMYNAKSNRLGVQLYLPSMTEEAKRKQELSEQLDEAMDKEQFALVFQPQINVRSKEIIGAEALLRWNRNGKFVSPSEFISLLEDSGSIVDVGRWVLREACQEAAEWSNMGRPVRMSVNVSTVQFERESFLDDVCDALELAELDPNLLELELTETVFLDEPEKAIANIEMLRDIGVSISIDDFGTGYSSLAYLKALPINRLKIDRSFVKDIPNYDDGMIAETIVSLAHNLGMSVIAEGVDTEAQLEFLSHRACDEYQGFLFSPPISSEACRKLLADSGSRRLREVALSS